MLPPTCSHSPSLGQGQGLQAEGGEGRVAAAEADHHELPDIGGDQEPAVGAGEGGEEADDERADDVDQERAPGNVPPKRSATKPEHQKRAMPPSALPSATQR